MKGEGKIFDENVKERDQKEKGRSGNDKLSMRNLLC